MVHLLFLFRLLQLLVVSLSWFSCAATPRNVLLVVVDDLRPEIGPYGITDVHTPHFDALAARSTVFDRAYCQQAVCGPSRSSFMTGRRPDAIQSWNFIDSFRTAFPGLVTMPGLFKDSGRLSLGVGKLFHPGLPAFYDGNKSWSDEALPYANPCFGVGVECWPCASQLPDNWLGLNAWCEQEAFEDTLGTDRGIELLQYAAKRQSNTSFLVGVGLHKPHLPWQASKDNFDLYPPVNATDMPKYRTAPKHAVGVALTAQHNLETPWKPLNESWTKAARRAYRAAVSETDHNLGRLLTALDELGLANNTAVVVFGDHGWQLGELGEWRKNTNFELGVRVPLLVSAPWLPQSFGRRSSSLVELVDIMPTLADLAGIAIPPNVSAALDGKSLVPILLNNSAEVKNVSLSQYPRRVKDASSPWADNGIDHVERRLFTHMGYSMRTDSFRITEWYTWNGTGLCAHWEASQLAGRELYDHRGEHPYPTDFNAPYETVNVAEDPQYASVVADLSPQLKQRFPLAPCPS